MTLTQLRYLLAIVDANLNITVAAERVNATQPGISKQVKLLEAELGFQIFIRRGKSLDRVSPSGALVIDRARVMLSEAGNIRTIAANQRGESSGELAIATTQTQARFVLPPALKRLKGRYPEVNVRLNLFTDLEGAAIAKEDADLVVASASGWPQTGEIVIPLYRWRRIALVPEGHSLAGVRGPLSLADLAAFPLIGYESALGSQASVQQAFAESGSPAEFAYATHDTEVIKTYVRTGLGVGLLAEMAGGETDGLVRLPVEGLPSCHAFALLRQDRVLRDYVFDFLASLLPHISRRQLARSLHPGGPPTPTSAPEWSEWLQQTNALAASEGGSARGTAAESRAGPHAASI